MLRSSSGVLAAAALVALLGAMSASRADDSLGDKAAAIGDAIKKGAQDTGTAVGNTVQEHVDPTYNSAKQGAQDAGTAVQQHTEATTSAAKQDAQDAGAA